MRSFALLSLATVLISCSPGTDTAPDLPQSVAPGWSRKALTKVSPGCWKAEYASGGSAVVNVCAFASEALALDAVQRTRAAADTVDFQQGRHFVTVRWNNVSQAEITALIRAIQRSVPRN